MGVIVVGGGIIGVSTAYFLAKRGESVTVIERQGIACAASGKAGGFLANEGWASKYCEELHEKGFALHQELAQVFCLETFRMIPSLSVSNGKGSIHSSFVNPLKAVCKPMDSNTAQVTPDELCNKMFLQCEGMGVKLVIDQVCGIDQIRNEVVLKKGSTLEFTKIVLCMEPWTCEAEDWLDGLSVPMTGIKSSSIIASTVNEVSPTALFCEEDNHSCHLEIYPRPNNTIYICGLGKSPHLN